MLSCVVSVQKVFRLISLCVCAFGAVASVSAAPSIARVWDEQILSAIRIDLPNPPGHARNLYHFSVVVYDAWAAYDPAPVGYPFREEHPARDVAAARREAISYAAYRLLTDRYSLPRTASTTLAALDAQLAALGYDKTNFSLDTSTPAGVGNSVAVAVASYFLRDGARQAYAYQDLPPLLGGYAPVNPPLDTGGTGTTVAHANRWQPLSITNAVSQNGIPIATIQKFVGPQWKAVRPFALTRDDSTLPWLIA